MGLSALSELRKQYELVEGCLLRLLEETAECYGDKYDYSDDIIALVDGNAKYKA